MSKFIKGAGISFIGQVLSTGLKYLTQASLAWIFGAESFGFYTLGLVIYQFCDLIARMGLELGAVRYVSIHQSSANLSKLKGVLISILCIPFILGCFLGITLFLCANTVAIDIFHKPELTIVLRLFSLAIPVGASMTTGLFATTGFQTTLYRVLVFDLIVPLTNLLLAVCLGLMGFKLFGASIAWVLALSIGLILTLFYIWRLAPSIISTKVKPIFQLKELISFSLPLSLGTFLWLLLIWTDILMLGFYNTASEVGIYRAASQTAFLMILFDRSLVTIFAPTIASLFNQGSLEEAKQLFKTSSRWNFALTLPLFIVLIVSSQNILRVFGTDFQAGWIVLIILAAGQLTRAGGGSLSMHMLAMSGHQYLKLYGDIILAITNIILNVVLIPLWGPLGAAIATAASIAGINIVRVLQVKYVLHVYPYSFRYLKVLLCGVISALSGYFVQYLLKDNFYIISMLISTSIMLIVYFLIFFYFAMDEDDKILISQQANKLKQIL